MAGVQIPVDLLAMMVRGVSVIAASHDAQLRPSLMRAVGSDVAADRSEITIYLVREQSRQLLQDIAAGGRLAVVFSEPSTHRSVQLKAARARLRDASPDDAPVLASYLASMEHEIECVGHSAPFARAMLAHRLEHVVAVCFVPEQAFEQTPGPRAGSSLGAST